MHITTEAVDRFHHPVAIPISAAQKTRTNRQKSTWIWHRHGPTVPSSEMIWYIIHPQVSVNTLSLTLSKKYQVRNA